MLCGFGHQLQILDTTIVQCNAKQTTHENALVIFALRPNRGKLTGMKLAATYWHTHLLSTSRTGCDWWSFNHVRVLSAYEPTSSGYFFLSGQRGVTDVLILNYGHTGGTLIYHYSRLAEINHSFDVARDV